MFHRDLYQSAWKLHHTTRKLFDVTLEVTGGRMVNFVSLAEQWSRTRFGVYRDTCSVQVCQCSHAVARVTVWHAFDMYSTSIWQVFETFSVAIFAIIWYSDWFPIKRHAHLLLVPLHRTSHSTPRRNLDRGYIQKPATTASSAPLRAVSWLSICRQ